VVLSNSSQALQAQHHVGNGTLGHAFNVTSVDFTTHCTFDSELLACIDEAEEVGVVLEHLGGWKIEDGYR
jgi:hypothetical protein